MGPLEKESEKARKFLELSARRKTLEVTLWTDGVHRAKECAVRCGITRQPRPITSGSTARPKPPRRG